MNNVQVVEVAKATCSLIQNLFDADQFLKFARILSFDVILKRRCAKFHCNVSELPITFCAKISDDILVRVWLSQQTDFTIS